LKEYLKKKQPELEELNKELAVSLEVSKVEKEIADVEERTVSGESEIVKEKTDQANVLKEDAESDLRKAEPIMQDAKKAVEKVSSNAITEIKGFKAPPEKCVMVLECIMLFLGKKADWDTAKAEM
jgi:dynein heavy chain